MTSPYGPILTGIGLLDGGKLTPAGRANYVAEVIGLLVTGNANGQGGLPTTQIFNNLIPLPPVPGPVIFNVTTLESEPLFWFKPDPVAAIMATTLVDPKQCPIWNMMFPDGIYKVTAEALDLNGNTPLFPLFDISCAFPDLKGFPIALPDLAVEADILPPPKLLIKLAELGIQLSIPSIPSPPSLPIPSLDLKFPGLALEAAVALPKLILGLIELPFKIIEALLLPPSISLVLDLIQFKFDAVFKLAFDIVVKLLAPLIPIVPKILLASILIWLKDTVSMLCVDLVGMLVGAGGVLTKSVGVATGLIPAST